MRCIPSLPLSTWFRIVSAAFARCVQLTDITVNTGKYIPLDVHLQWTPIKHQISRRSGRTPVDTFLVNDPATLMECPACETAMVPFAVPEAHRAQAPDGASAAALCPACLTLSPVEDDAPSPAEADFSRVIEGFPDGDAGVAMALAVGLLVDSLALNRDAVKEFFDAVSDAGEDPWLVLERLAVAGTVQPEADLAKLRRQLDQLWR